MTTSTASLADFLLARIAEDETAAAPPTECTCGPSAPYSSHDWNCLMNPANHIANPRVLAECEAKRRIVAEWQTFAKVAAERDSTPLPEQLTRAGIVVGLDRAVRALALPYADHPDYRDEWRA